MTEFQLKRVTIEGFKSIRSLREFELRPINVMIGPNGSGKSNFLSVFPFLRADVRGYLDRYVTNAGGADALCFLGPQITPIIRIEYELGKYEYGSVFEVTSGNDLFQIEGHIGGSVRYDEWNVAPAAPSTRADMHQDSSQDDTEIDVMKRCVSGWVTYHFHDTGKFAGMKRDQNVRHDQYLEPDGSNVAAYLRGVRERDRAAYDRILSTVRLVAPFLDDFILEPREMGEEEKVRLEWRQRGSDYPFQPYQLSDGTLRFICLVVALSQPDPPPIIIIDEPELGLHPEALELFAELIRQAPPRTQVIVSTQSPTLLNHFDVADIIVVQRDGPASTFSRLDEKELATWLDTYTVGELWQKNVIEGGTTIA